MSLNIGIVGGGKFGLMHLRVFTQLRRQGKVDEIALAEIDDDLRQERVDEFNVTGYPDHATMLEEADLDAVTVVTPDFLHREIALDIIGSGRHALVEKPLDTTVEGCREIAEAAEDAGVLVEVDFHKRFDPFHIQLREAIEDGELGVPEYGYAWMEDRIEVPRDWFPHWAPKSSSAWFLGVHMIDLFRWCIGGRNGRRVWATGQRRKLKSLGVDAWDAVEAKIEFEDNISFHLDTSWILPDDFEAVVNQGIRVVGSEGLGEVDSQDRGARLTTPEGGHRTFNPVFFLEETLPTGETAYSGYGVASIAVFADHVNHIKEGGTLEELEGHYAGPRDGLEVTRIAEGIHKSLEKGGIVEL
ncbi:MAG: Gfo/Idh/MocA family oxidoreductase [Planctomycetes bacterium]|nr:Gfo/Idh/MocA family oxidoreductase [Planctomycetota bacterium]